jgi:hypothetical protein
LVCFTTNLLRRSEASRSTEVLGCEEEETEDFDRGEKDQRVEGWRCPPWGQANETQDDYVEEIEEK